MPFISPTVQRRNDSKNSAAQNPRKISKRRRIIPINFKNGAGFIKFHELKKAAKF